MHSDSIAKIIGVVVVICLVAAIFVSSAAVGLKPVQEENKKLDLIKNILIAGDLYNVNNSDIREIFESKVSSEIINLETGNIVPKSLYDDELNVENFDLKTISNSKKHSKLIPPEKDIAGIVRMPKSMVIYKVLEGNEINKFILPIYGKGLWSTLYGFIALDKDLRTVKGFTFYEHGETPGLGGEVDNPRWKQKWIGKQAFDEDWNLRIEVIKGLADPTKDSYKHQIDGLSGSTLTTRGVNNLVRFWLGTDGYGNYIEKLRKEKLSEKV